VLVLWLALPKLGRLERKIRKALAVAEETVEIVALLRDIQREPRLERRIVQLGAARLPDLPRVSLVARRRAPEAPAHKIPLWRISGVDLLIARVGDPREAAAPVPFAGAA
jgi:hypothetical protein